MKLAAEGILACLACVLALTGVPSYAQVAPAGSANGGSRPLQAYSPPAPPSPIPQAVVPQANAEVIAPGPPNNGSMTTLANTSALEAAAAANNGLLPPNSMTPPAGPVTDSCSVYYGHGADCPPTWSVNQGVRLLNRSRPHLLRLGEEFVTTPTTRLINVIDTRSTSFDAAIGYTLTINRYLGRDSENRDDSIEFTYWGLNNWKRDYTVNGGRLFLNTYSFGDLFSPIGQTANIYDTPVAGFSRADQMSVVYESEVHNFEWNLRLKPHSKIDRMVLHPDGRWEREVPTGHTCEYLIGIRYLAENESFAFRSQGTIENNGVALGTTTGDYLIFTQNNFVGLQAGADLTYRKARWDWGARIKAGPYINWAQQSSHETSTNAGIDTANGFSLPDLDNHTAARIDKMAFIGEVGLTASYKLRPNFIAHCSYDFIWIEGIAMAPEQVRYETNPPDRISAVSTMLLQGVTLTAEITW